MRSRDKNYGIISQKKGLRNSPQREVILEELIKHPGHVTIETLWNRVKKVDSSIGYATVYRALRLFTECEIADRREFGDKGSRYEEVTGSHHDHMICTHCGGITEFKDNRIEKLQDKICEDYSFKMTIHKLELYGLCHKCQRK